MSRDQNNFRDIFISYARGDDESFAKRLYLDLKKHEFSVWWDRKVMESRGTTFLREIRDGISASKRVLLIVGPKVIQSKYVEMEWRHALREGVVVTPLLRLGAYDGIPEALQALHCEDIRSSIPETESFENVRRLVSTPILDLGPLVGVPWLPTPYLERPESFDHLRSRVLIDSYLPLDLEADERITSLTGMGGVGKSILAVALARASDVRRSFQDGIIWIPVGRNYNTLSTLTLVGSSVGDETIDRYTGVTEARLLLEKTLSKKNCLLILDDVWEVEVAEMLQAVAGKNVRILLTSRKRKLLASAGVHEVPIDVMSDNDSLDLLAGWMKLDRKDLPPEAKDIVKECGKLPLALAMIGAMLRKRPNRWGYALERLRRADLTKISQNLSGYEYETLDRAMLVSFEDLDMDQQERYLDFVVIPEGSSAPESMLLNWWSNEGIDKLDATSLLDDLVDRSLLRVNEHQDYLIHDVQRDFLVIRTDDIPGLHDRWLTAFRITTSDGWASAQDDGYLYDNLGHHLRSAGREQEWQNLLISFEWLSRKTETRGFPAVLQDLSMYKSELTIGPLHRIGRRMAHILTNDPTQLAAQLIAGIQNNSGLESLLEGARTWRGISWLRPVTSSLSIEGDPTLAVFRGREKNGHAGTPSSIALSEDSALIVSGGGSSNDRTIKAWSVEAAVLLRTYEEGVTAGELTLLAFVTRDSFVGAKRHEVQLYSLHTNEPIAGHKFERAKITSICAGGGIIFIGFEDGHVIRWNPSTDTTETLRKSDNDRIKALAYSTNSNRLAIATISRVECHNVTNGQLIGHVEKSIDDSESYFGKSPLIILPDGSQVFFGNLLNTWTVDENTSKVAMPNFEYADIVDFTEDGKVVLTCPDSRVELLAIEIETGQQIACIRNSQWFSCVAFARNGQLAVTGDSDHDVKVWDLTPSKQQVAAAERHGHVVSVVISDDKRVALVETDEKPELWDTANGVPRNHQYDFDRYFRRGQSIIDKSKMKEIKERLNKKMDITLNEKFYNLIKIPNVNLAFTLKAGRAVSAPIDDQIKTADKEEELYSQKNGGFNYPLALWDLKNLRKPLLLKGHTMQISCMDITADGKFALSGSVGRVLRLWNLDNGECIQELRGHRGSVYQCALTEDARLAISGSEDMTVRLWDLVEGKLLFSFAVPSAVNSCDISRDGTVAIAVEVSGRIHTFSVEERNNQ